MGKNKKYKRSVYQSLAVITQFGIKSSFQTPCGNPCGVPEYFYSRKEDIRGR